MIYYLGNKSSHVHRKSTVRQKSMNDFCCTKRLKSKSMKNQKSLQKYVALNAKIGKIQQDINLTD